MCSHDSGHVKMQIECPKCHKKMILQVALAPDTTNNVLECPKCLNTLIPLVPGPIVGGPFSVDVRTECAKLNSVPFALSDYFKMEEKDLTPQQLISVLCPICGLYAGPSCILNSGGLPPGPHINQSRCG